MNKKKKKVIIIYFILLGFLIISTYTICNYTRIGYMGTISIHGYTEIVDNVYIDKKYTGNSDELIKTISKANERVADFWGTLESKPTIIISSDKEKLKKLGYNGSPFTSLYVFHGAICFTILSTSDLNIDIIAHELTHSELYSRVYKNKWYNSSLIPVWFNEGIAMQNDYRDMYNEEAWKNITDDGKNVKDINTIASFSDFYNSNSVENYIISKHEISEWIRKNGFDALINIMQKINQGKKFNNLYFN